jgi:hypothetical protein
MDETNAAGAFNTCIVIIRGIAVFDYTDSPPMPNHVEKYIPSPISPSFVKPQKKERRKKIT